MLLHPNKFRNHVTFFGRPVAFQILVQPLQNIILHEEANSYRALPI